MQRAPLHVLTDLHPLTPDDERDAAIQRFAAAVVTQPEAMRETSRAAGVAALLKVVDDEHRAAHLLDHAIANANEWGEPAELPGLSPVPTWNDALLPDALRPWLSDVAERTQCPPEYPAVAALVSLASVIGRGCAMRPKVHDDWTVVPNLWGAIVGPPSAMKTPALSEGTRPLSALARQSSESHSAREFERVALEAQLAALKKQMVQAASKGTDPFALRLEFERLQAATNEANAERRFVVYDATVEKLGELLRDSPRGLLLFRDELTGWFSSLDRQGHEQDRSFYLEAWNGTGGYVYDRIARGTVTIDAACVSVLGGIQPGPLGSYLRAAADGGAGDDGLVQRFQLLVFPDAPKDWRNVDRWPDSAARTRAFELFERLARVDAAQLGADTSAGIPFLRFAPDAQEFFTGWRTALELRLRSGDESPVIEAHLAKYRSLLPSLALIFHLADAGHGPVTLHSAQRAAAWCEFLEAHARRVYGAASGGHTGARALLGRLRSGKLRAPFVERDVYRAQWSGLTDSEAVSAAVNTLVEHGWLRRVSVPTTGRPRMEIHAHPSLEVRP